VSYNVVNTIWLSDLGRGLRAIGDLPAAEAEADVVRQRLVYHALWSAAARGDIPVVRIGNRLAVPRDALPEICRWVGLVPRAAPASASASSPIAA
jgi:hypothetical protein